MTPRRRCPRCGDTKRVSEFLRNADGTLSCYCRSCVNAYQNAARDERRRRGAALLALFAMAQPSRHDAWITTSGTGRVPLSSRSGEIVGYATVDGSDIGLVAGRRWHRTDKGYAAHSSPQGRQLMHRLLLGFAPGSRLPMVDHRNGDTLDNRRQNLRVADRNINGQNRRGAARGARSRHRNVHYRRDRDRWVVSVQVDGRSTYVGSFLNEDDAGAAATKWRKDHMPNSEADT